MWKTNLYWSIEATIGLIAVRWNQDMVFLESNTKNIAIMDKCTYITTFEFVVFLGGAFWCLLRVMMGWWELLRGHWSVVMVMVIGREKRRTWLGFALKPLICIFKSHSSTITLILKNEKLKNSWLSLVLSRHHSCKGHIFRDQQHWFDIKAANNFLKLIFLVISLYVD